MSDSLVVGVLLSRVRVEEKLLLADLEKRSVEIVRFDDREFTLDLSAPDAAMARCDVVLERCINHLRALYTLRVLNDWGVPTVNTYDVANICGDKLLTSTALERAGVPQPRTIIAFTPESALEACEELGYPVVMKPAVGSWGRLLARVNDRDAAEALLEHKVTLGSFHHGAFYIQEFVQQAGAGHPLLRRRRRDDLRHLPRLATLDHQHGARRRCQQLPRRRLRLNCLSLAAAKAVGGGVVAIDLFESERGLLVNEVNYTMEFRNSIDTTGVDIPARIVDYVISVGNAERARRDAALVSSLPSAADD